jgi:hypothetical protein
MKPYTDNFEAREMSTKVPYPPAGAYIGRILGVKLEDGRNGDQVITLQVDVTEGDYTGHYHRMLEHDRAAGFSTVRYTGQYRLTAPGKDNPYYDSRDRAFRSDIWAVEQSNPGYKWDWDENSLLKKNVGFVVRDAEFINDRGELNAYTEIGCLTPVDKVRKGTAPTLKKREAKASSGAAEKAGYVKVDDEPLPFD